MAIASRSVCWGSYAAVGSVQRIVSVMSMFTPLKNGTISAASTFCLGVVGSGPAFRTCAVRELMFHFSY